jgi:hypothetical protein
MMREMARDMVHIDEKQKMGREGFRHLPNCTVPYLYHQSHHANRILHHFELHLWSLSKYAEHRCLVSKGGVGADNATGGSGGDWVASSSSSSSSSPSPPTMTVSNPLCSLVC